MGTGWPAVGGAFNGTLASGLACSGGIALVRKARAATHPAHFKSCAACRTVVCCCREHQVAGWPGHKKACKAARKAAEDDDASALEDLQALVLRSPERSCSFLHSPTRVLFVLWPDASMQRCGVLRPCCACARAVARKARRELGHRSLLRLGLRLGGQQLGLEVRVGAHGAEASAAGERHGTRLEPERGRRSRRAAGPAFRGRRVHLHGRHDCTGKPPTGALRNPLARRR